MGLHAGIRVVEVVIYVFRFLAYTSFHNGADRDSDMQKSMPMVKGYGVDGQIHRRIKTAVSREKWTIMEYCDNKRRALALLVCFIRFQKVNLV